MLVETIVDLMFILSVEMPVPTGTFSKIVDSYARLHRLSTNAYNRTVTPHSSTRQPADVAYRSVR